MKQSYYNVFVPLQNGGVLYNTRTQGLIELSETESVLIANVEECQNNSFLSALSDAKFLVEDPEAEADFLLYQQSKYRCNMKVFELTISPTRMCNFNCEYCYIKKRTGMMSLQTQSAVMDFIDLHYSSAPFQKLKINWYGGEPLLAIDVMESLSTSMLAFCKEHNVEFFSHALTNGSLADDEMCQRLVKNCSLTTIMPTLSGNGVMHDYQRQANDEKEHFRELMQNIESMRRSGLLVHANFVVNHNNFNECCDLVSELSQKEGIVIRLTRTFPFENGQIVLKDGTNLHLFDREEFGDSYANFHHAQKLSAVQYAEVLKPTRLYCAAYVNRSFFIDELGDVFACMVDMDYEDRALCSVANYQQSNSSFNWKRFLQFSNLEPLRDPVCRSCRVLPICQGGCACNRLVGDDVCHDMKECIEDIVLDYYRATTRDDVKS